MIAQPFRVDSDRSHQRVILRLLGEQRQHFTQIEPARFGRNRLELATDFRGSIGLRVPQVDVAWRALQVNKDDRISELETQRTQLEAEVKEHQEQKEESKGEER